MGMKIEVSDEQLSKALEVLPEKKQNIILLSYFMDMSDSEIGKLMIGIGQVHFSHSWSISKIC